MNERKDTYWKRTQLRTLMESLLQGNTYKEVAEEFGYGEDWVKRKMRWIRQDYPEKYCKIKNKPYMVFQRIIYKGCTLDEALKAFHLSEERFWNFMKEVLQKDPKLYIKVRSSIHNSRIRS